MPPDPPTPGSPTPGGIPPSERYGAELAAARGELLGLLLSTTCIEDLLTELARTAAAVLTVSCGITLRHDHGPWTVAASDAVAGRLDERQYVGGDGPCLQALRTGVAVMVTDMGTESRWGPYPAHALAQGVRSSLSLPLTVNGEHAGALNLYAHTLGAFTPEVDAQARVFADQVVIALTVAVRQARQVALSEQLRAALASRSVIDQAIGVIMAQRRVGAEAAFAVLRVASQRRNRKLREIAAEVVGEVGGYPPGAALFTEAPD